MKYIEILFWKIAKRIIIRGYGADCEEKDELGLCDSCKAKEVVDWIDKHIELIRF